MHVTWKYSCTHWLFFSLLWCCDGLYFPIIFSLVHSRVCLPVFACCLTIAEHNVKRIRLDFRSICRVYFFFLFSFFFAPLSSSRSLTFAWRLCFISQLAVQRISFFFCFSVVLRFSKLSYFAWLFFIFIFFSFRFFSSFYCTRATGNLVRFSFAFDVDKLPELHWKSLHNLFSLFYWIFFYQIYEQSDLWSIRLLFFFCL